jgi:hypothetical protein
MKTVISNLSAATRLEEFMYRIVRPASAVLVTLIVGACATASTSSPSLVPPVAATPGATVSVVTSSQAASPSAATSSTAPTAFTSKTYGYSVTLPAGWTAVEAQGPWDGKGMPGSDAAEADHFKSSGTASSWLLRAPSTNDLAAQVKQVIAANLADHGSTCPPLPATQDPIKIGEEPGVLLSYDCGILINIATTVHTGQAYVIALRDPGIHAATDPADRATFLGLLESVKFSD